MPASTTGVDPPGCCTRLLKRLCRCFGDSSDSETESNSRTGRSELYQYEAPAATASAGAAQLQHVQRPAAVYEDEADPGGPLLPKTTESSALVPPVRPGHSRNNSSASATAAAAAASASHGGGPDLHSSLTKRLSGTLGLGDHVLGAPAGGLGSGPGSAGRPGIGGGIGGGGGAAHRRTASQGDAKRQQWAASGKEHAHQHSADAHAPVHPHPHVHTPAGAAAACDSPGAPSTAAGRPGAVFGPVQDEDDDFCPTCLEAYTTENPKIFTECGHHFHMPCIYAWLERKDTCPMCESPMQAPGLM
ncbi:hypothetical protein HXX76_000034 [Chlamydomonas incerta]|uniref:RING-type E3 ubiquitin transferase n=1 Tax=Chlamydomonas incerta TaxID=51695 RepID=A0A835WDI4_CHLIN|nr:hypothetical protein HXX76_000034 [Chlamydomonas incerta]|eukprot:KAG2445412.1 hypothetical protein HXX76_000034 [Chlamydomonas incerta]